VRLGSVVALHVQKQRKLHDVTLLIAFELKLFFYCDDSNPCQRLDRTTLGITHVNPEGVFGALAHKALQHGPLRLIRQLIPGDAVQCQQL
jgi:hypothetical protein